MCMLDQNNMNKSPKIVTWIIKSLLVVAVMVIIAAVVAPRLTNLETVKESIKDRVSRDVGGEIKFRQIELAYFPRPHFVIHKTEIDIPDGFKIKILLLKIYPKILPLLRGSLQPAIVRVEYPDYFLRLPQLNTDAKLAERRPALDDSIKSALQAVRSLPEFKLPRLNLRIKKGKVNLVDPFGHRYKLREVNGKYIRDARKFEFSLECKSNLWDRISIKALLDPSNFKGKGRIQLSEFHPQALFGYLFPDSELKISDTKANVNINLESDQSGQIRADVNGTIPLLKITKGKKELTIKDNRIKGSIQIDGKRATVAVDEVSFATPQLKMSGTFQVDRSRQALDLNLRASQIAVESVREMALKLADDNELIGQIFNIIRGGMVPWMTVQTTGRTIEELGHLDNIVIQGKMTAGKIFIPVARLDLVDVEGDADISKGILRGENLRAQMGKSEGRQGKLVLGLTEDISPFYLDIDIDGDLSQLPPVLNRVVNHKDFLSELARLHDVSGSATGNLTLSDESGSLNPRVEVSKVHLKTNYDRIPYPIKIDGGYFLFEGSKIAFNNIAALIGNSSIPKLSAFIDWVTEPHLKAASETTVFSLNEVYPWLTSFKALRRYLESVTTLKGTVSLQNTDLSGPLFQPQKWQVQTQGSVSNVILSIKKLHEPITVPAGQFSWQGHQIAYRNFDARLGKSSVSQLSGNLNWKKTPFIAGRSGPALVDIEDMTPVLSSFENLSKGLREFKPLTGTLALKQSRFTSPLSGATLGQVKFSAVIEIFAILSNRLPGPLRVNAGKFTLQNNQLTLERIDAILGKSTVTQLAAVFAWNKEASLAINFESMELLLEQIYPRLKAIDALPPAFKHISTAQGVLRLRDMDVNGPLKRPADWEYRSFCEMQNLTLTSTFFGGPVLVREGQFKASSDISSNGVNRHRLELEVANFSWEEHQMTLSGEMTASKRQIVLDFDLVADGLVWNQIENILNHFKQIQSDPQTQWSNTTLRGSLRIKTDNFYYKTLVVHPLEAEVLFKPDLIEIPVKTANFCDISLQGFLKVSQQTLEIYFVPAAKAQELNSSLACITEKKNLVTGKYDFDGEIMAKTKPDALRNALVGHLSFSAEEGRIYRFGLLAKIFAILNVTEIYRGEVPDLRKDGFAYHSMKARARLQGSKIVMEDCSIDGASMGIACEGDIDLVDMKMDLVILVAPFKTVDRIVKVIPLVSGVLGGKLISIPFKAKGDIKDPAVYALPPSAVGSGIMGIMERTLKLPITVFQPIMTQINNNAGRRLEDTKDPPR